MKTALNLFIDFALDFREVSGGILNSLWLYLVGISLVVSLILLWLIVYSLIGSGWVMKKYDNWSDILGVGDMGRRRQLRAWKRIMKQIKKGDVESWKMAILEADKIFDEILKMSGYRGEDVHERFFQLPQEAISNRDKIVASHEIRDKILTEPDFTLSNDEALTILRNYQRALKELGLIE